jgi:hypothetical protein
MLFLLFCRNWHFFVSALYSTMCWPTGYITVVSDVNATVSRMPPRTPNACLQERGCERHMSRRPHTGERPTPRSQRHQQQRSHRHRHDTRCRGTDRAAPRRATRTAAPASQSPRRWCCAPSPTPTPPPRSLRAIRSHLERETAPQRHTTRSDAAGSTHPCCPLACRTQPDQIEPTGKSYSKKTAAIRWLARLQDATQS